MENAKFKLGSDCIEISGPQGYVEEQLENFKDLIKLSYEKILSLEPEKRLSDKIVNKTSFSPGFLLKNSSTEDADFIEIQKGAQADYENVITVQADVIQLNCDIPGTTKSKQMINFVLIYMWGKLKQGIDSVSYSELREQGKNYIEFDTTNFAKYMISHRNFFLITGDKNNKTAKLIRPGMKEAERLITDLNKS